jgi:hypothetical protein
LTSPFACSVTPADAGIFVENQCDINFINIADRGLAPPYNRGPRSATSFSQPSRIPFSEGSGRRGPIAPAAILFSRTSSASRITTPSSRRSRIRSRARSRLKVDLHVDDASSSMTTSTHRRCAPKESERRHRADRFHEHRRMLLRDASHVR